MKRQKFIFGVFLFEANPAIRFKFFCLVVFF
ncbi:hypothetical protein FPSM_00704 [Flavobacterium psychrophilum]|nr:hypothetical protein FPSM_00704 [Flavobacterium psychrophilum]